MDHEILKIVQGCLNADKQLKEVEIINTAVEPNITYVGQYKKSIEGRSDTSDPSNVRFVKFDLRPISFEEYAASSHYENQYDMVHAIHSLYYVDMESTLKHCYYKELREKGLILCYIGNDSDIVGVTTSIVSKCRPEMQRQAGSNAAENVIRIAEKNSMKYEKITVPFSIDVTSIFNEGSAEARELFNFLAYEDNYLQKASPNEVKEVLKKIEDLSTKDESGRLIMNVSNELILIYKTP